MKPNLYRYMDTHNAKFAVGIDIGGTNTVLGLVSADGQVPARRHLPTQEYDNSGKYIRDLIAEIRELTHGVGTTALDGIGIGAPNADFHNGCIGKDTANLLMKDEIPLKREIEAALGVPVTVSNDANAAAYGEYVYGAAKGMRHFILFTLGTGVGSGIVVDGRLVHGHTGKAGELGHCILVPGGRLCSCGRRGCLEMYASARGICMTYREIREQTHDRGALSGIPDNELTCKMIGDAANAGDPAAVAAYAQTGSWLGLAMANAATFSAPQAIIVTGGPAQAGDVLLAPARASFERNLLMVYRDEVQILPSQLPGNDAAVLGAAALVRC